MVWCDLAEDGDMNVIKATSMLSSDGRERQIARLLAEIDQLKDHNRKVPHSDVLFTTNPV